MSIVKCKCPYCGWDEAEQFVVEGENGRYETLTCFGCKQVIYEQNSIHNQQQPNNPQGVTCPYCHSTDCKKISTASKVGKTLMWGILAAGAVSKTWHCNNCGSNFG